MRGKAVIEEGTTGADSVPRGGYRGGAMGALAPPFPKVGGSTVCARAASRNYNWTIYSK